MPLAGAAAGFVVRPRLRLVRDAAHGRLLRHGHAGAGRAALHAGADLDRRLRRRIRHLHDADALLGRSTSGATRHVYYLTLAWVVGSTWCLWAFTRTPMGRLALGLRDNEHRVRFLGFNTHGAKTLIFAHLDHVHRRGRRPCWRSPTRRPTTPSSAPRPRPTSCCRPSSAASARSSDRRSGPPLMTFFARVTSDLTRSWLLYQGLIFVIVMLFVPDGIGGLISVHARRLRATAIKHLTVPYLLWLVVGGAAGRRPRLRRRERARGALGCLPGPAPRQRRGPGPLSADGA